MFVAGVVWATSTYALDLRQSVLTALARVEESKIAASQIRQGQYRVSEAQSAFYPVLSARVQLGPQYRKPGFSNEVDDLFFGYLTRVSIEQHLLDGESRKFLLEGAKLDLKGSEFQARSVLESVVIDVVSSYLDVVFNREIVRIQRSNLKAFQRIESRVIARAAGGALAGADAQQVKARVVSADAALSRAQLNLAESEYAYTRLVGPVENDMSIPFEVSDFFFENYNLLLEKVRTKNSSLQQARFSRRSALAAINVAKAAYWPALEVQTFAQHSDSLAGGQGSILDAGILLNINYSYNFGGVAGSAVDRSQERSKELALLRRLLIRDIEADLQTQYSNYQSFKRVLRALRLEIQANEKVLSAQLEQQNIGQVRVLDLVTAQERVTDSRIRLLTNQQDDQATRYSILNLTGELLPYFKSSR